MKFGSYERAEQNDVTMLFLDKMVRQYERRILALELYIAELEEEIAVRDEMENA